MLDNYFHPIALPRYSRQLLIAKIRHQLLLETHYDCLLTEIRLKSVECFYC